MQRVGCAVLSGAMRSGAAGDAEHDDLPGLYCCFFPSVLLGILIIIADVDLVALVLDDPAARHRGGWNGGFDADQSRMGLMLGTGLS